MPDLTLTPNHMRVGTGHPPILRCSACQAPVRSATPDEAAAVLLSPDEQLPDPIDECMFCAPARRRAGDVARAQSIAATTLVGPVRPVLVGGRVVQLTVLEADALMRALARTIWVMTGDPSADAWVEPYLSELCAFPTAKHDDRVDGSSCAFNALMDEPLYVPDKCTF